MNGANLHETGVRQMGRAEGGGRGDEERERRSGCWRRGGRGGNRHRVNVSYRVAVKWWMLGRNLQGIFTILLQKMAHLARVFVYILKSYFHCVTSGEDKTVRSTGRSNNTINLIKPLDARLITHDASKTFPGCYLFCNVGLRKSVRSIKQMFHWQDFCNKYIHMAPF